MEQLPNVVIVMSHCSQNRESFGIRFEEQVPGLWAADWAFPVPEKQAKKEGYDSSAIKGDFAFHKEYPGCPHCRSTSMIFCARCERVSCYDGHSSTARCGWCGFSSQVGHGDVGELKVGGDLL